jgi:thioredoxin reductase
MVMGVEEIPARLNDGGQTRTSIPNLFMVGDTVSSEGFGTPSVVSSSLALANQLSK